MIQIQLLLLVLAAPFVAQAAMFTKDSHVQMLDAKMFKKVMKKDETSLVAFVAPWCGHCQRMVPELSKAAKALNPLVPTYAVDCDQEPNKRLCSEQEIKGFPTVKLFPRGSSQSPIPYEGERVASGFFHFTARRIPNKNKKLTGQEDVAKWAAKKQAIPKALLLSSKDAKPPLLWQVLSQKFQDKLGFAFFNDKNDKLASSSSPDLFFDNTGSVKGKSKLILFGEKMRQGVVYDGVMKMEVLTQYFQDVVDGVVDLSPLPKEEETVTDEEMPVPPQEPMGDEEESSTAEEVPINTPTEQVPINTPVEEEPINTTTKDTPINTTTEEEPAVTTTPSQEQNPDSTPPKDEL